MAINLQRQKILTQLITKFKYIAINQKTSPLLFRAYNNSNTTIVSINLDNAIGQNTMTRFKYNSCFY